MSDKKILYTSNESATYKTNISGWVSSNGRFYGKDEHLARWAGCTHKICPNCGNEMEKMYTICSDCREKKAIERYYNMESKTWDGKSMLYSDSYDQYFNDLDDICDFLSDNEGVTEFDLRLIICEPNMLPEVDSSYFGDELPDDGELPTPFLKLLDDFNSELKSFGPISWSPSKYSANCIGIITEDE